MQDFRPTADQLSAIEATNRIALARLMKFYKAETLEQLVWQQSHHIERLQEQLATKDSFTRTYGVRQG